MNRGLDWLWMRRGSVTVWYEYDGAGVWLVSRSLDRSPGDCLSLCVAVVGQHWWCAQWMGEQSGAGRSKRLVVSRKDGWMDVLLLFVCPVCVLCVLCSQAVRAVNGGAGPHVRTDDKCTV